MFDTTAGMSPMPVPASAVFPIATRSGPVQPEQFAVQISGGHAIDEFCNDEDVHILLTIGELNTGFSGIVIFAGVNAHVIVFSLAVGVG